MSSCLENVIDEEIPSAYVEEWPLFIQYRETNQYKEFVDKHKELFETKEYEPENQLDENSEEMIIEFGDVKRDKNVEEVEIPPVPIENTPHVEYE